MKHLLLTLSIVGLAYGASISKDEMLKDLKQVNTLRDLLQSFGVSRNLDGDSVDEEGVVVTQDGQSYYSDEDDLDWRCVWQKREALMKCSKDIRELYEIEQSICILKEIIDCYRYRSN